MDHGHHHGSDSSGPMCSMNMLFTWNVENLCIVFRFWRVTGRASLIASLFLIIVICAGYELIREISRRCEVETTQPTDLSRHHHHHRNDEAASLLLAWSGSRAYSRSYRYVARSRIIRALFYAIQVYYSFFIMLLFMTYNGWVMLSVAIGAFFGYLFFSNCGSAKAVTCH